MHAAAKIRPSSALSVSTDIYSGIYFIRDFICVHVCVLILLTDILEFTYEVWECFGSCAGEGVLSPFSQCDKLPHNQEGNFMLR